MVRKDVLVIGGFCAAIGVVLIPIYVMPKLNPQPYGKHLLCFSVVGFVSLLLL